MSYITGKLRKIDEELEKGSPAGRLSHNQRATLATDGSVTSLLEALVEKTVGVRCVRQEHIVSGRIDESYRRALKIDENEVLNEREVLLAAGDRELIYALSYAVISRLDEGFKDDVTSTDIPIGRIIKKHKIECRREILDMGVVDGKSSVEYISKFGSKVPYRKYVIIHMGLPIIHITEYLGKF